FLEHGGDGGRLAASGCAADEKEAVLRLEESLDGGGWQPEFFHFRNSFGQESQHPAQAAPGGHAVDALAPPAHADAVVDGAGLGLQREPRLLQERIVIKFAVAAEDKGFPGSDIEVTHSGILRQLQDAIAEGCAVIELIKDGWSLKLLHVGGGGW